MLFHYSLPGQIFILRLSLHALSLYRSFINSVTAMTNNETSVKTLVSSLFIFGLDRSPRFLLNIQCRSFICYFHLLIRIKTTIDTELNSEMILRLLIWPWNHNLPTLTDIRVLIKFYSSWPSVTGQRDRITNGTPSLESSLDSRWSCDVIPGNLHQQSEWMFDVISKYIGLPLFYILTI